ncbi:uncharacterized protein TNCV_637441 [Trichonephila clavipes]|nr:uncharacterized protein TNCV_637441 [Trichonephila clavipes]
MGHEDELMIEEVQEILHEEHQETHRNVSPSQQDEDERPLKRTSAIKYLFKKWDTVRAIVLEWLPNQADVSRNELIHSHRSPCGIDDRLTNNSERVPILRPRIKSGQVSGSGRKVKAAAVRLLMPWRFLYILRPLALHVRKRDLRILFYGCPIKVHK